MKKAEVQGILQKVRQAYPQFFQGLGVTPDFTLRSIQQLEQAIRQYPKGETPMSTTVFACGIYLGDVIRNQVSGAVWVFDDLESFTDLRLKAADLLSLPVLRVEKFWNDPTDSLFDWCNMIIAVAEGQINPSHYKAGDSVDLGNGVTIRFQEMK